MENKNKSAYNLNYLLVIANIVICAIGAVFYAWLGDTKYVNNYTLILLCIFGVENIFMLSYEKKKNDPFVIILILVAVIFYMGRVVSLMYDSSSPSLDHSPYFKPATPEDFNYSLLFIMLSNVSILLGLNAVKNKILYKGNSNTEEQPGNPRNIILLLLCVFLLHFSGILPILPLGRLPGYIDTIFISYYLILLFTAVYLILNHNKISKRYRNIIFSFFLFYILLAMLQGSRSAFLSIAMLFLVGFLAIWGTITFSRKYLLISMLFIPVAISFAMLATHIRVASDNRSSFLNPIRQFNFLMESKSPDTKDVHGYIISPILNRLGFLDFSSDMITNSKQYEKVINIEYYYKSIIDNCLTPGFSIFGTPKVAFVLSYINRGKSLPTHETLTAGYQSDMLTVYGEYYVLFHGYIALLFIFISSYLFKRIYLSIKNNDIFLFYLYRTLILYVFYYWLNSFGIDWMVFDLIVIFVTVILYRNFYINKSRNAIQGHIKATS